MGTLLKKFKDNRELHRFIDRNKMTLSMGLSFLLQVCIILFWYVPDISFSKSLDELVEEVAFVDSLSIKEPADVKAEDGDFELTDKEKKEKEDPRVAGAQDVIIAGATSPIDMSPSMKPEYTSEAKAAGVTGTVTLEVVIADTGEVLRVRVLGKQLGYGLEDSAMRTFRSKRFSPSVLDGKPITVKVLIPVRFTLN